MHFPMRPLISFLCLQIVSVNSQRLEILPFVNLTNLTFTDDLPFEFPFLKFLESETLHPNHQYKKESHLCEGRNTDRSSSCCSCQNSCINTRNCCIDKFWNGSLSLERYLEEFNDIMYNKRSYDYRCSLLFGPKFMNKMTESKSESYFMISSCDESTKCTKDYKRCETSNYQNMRETIPVLSKGGQLYRSESCAKCNNVTKYKYLKISVVCQGHSEKNISMLNEMNCHFGLEMHNNKVYECSNSEHPKSRCRDPNYQRKCSSYSSFLNDGFANIDCYKCSGAILPAHLQYVDLLRESCEMTFNNLMSWAFTLDFSGKISNRQICETGEIYDVFEHQCLGKENFTNSIDKVEDNYEQIQRMMTFIGTSISLFFYAFLITTHLIFKELRNIPGLNTLALGVSFFISDFSLLTHGLYANSFFCKYFGISLHYLLLVGHMWLTIICFDLKMAMHSPISTTNRNKTKTFLKYLVIALLTPLLIVATSITLDSVGYINAGYADICWIKDFKTRLWFYIIPTAISFVLAIVALLSTLMKIYQTKKDTSKTLGSDQGNVDIVKIAAKLLIGLGFMEILGYIGSPEKVSSLIFSMCYVTVRSLKGVFLCVIFLFNKKVFRLYSRRILRRNTRETTVSVKNAKKCSVKLDVRSSQLK
ncbi:uncharacterized protein [Clytia hemisphaerica]|uniref:uncharacterized protein n=1 Tax=Clytia hemisphaerica TaxID=252671 RepID=UPI0034D74741